MPKPALKTNRVIRLPQVLDAFVTFLRPRLPLDLQHTRIKVVQTDGPVDQHISNLKKQRASAHLLFPDLPRPHTQSLWGPSYLKIDPCSSGPLEERMGGRKRRTSEQALRQEAIRRRLLGESRSAICRARGLSLRRFYEWRRKYQDASLTDLANQLRASLTSPQAIPASVEAASERSEAGRLKRWLARLTRLAWPPKGSYSWEDSGQTNAPFQPPWVGRDNLWDQNQRRDAHHPILPGESPRPAANGCWAGF